MRINQNHPARKSVATIGDYHNSVGAAINAASNALEKHGIALKDTCLFGYLPDDGSATLDLQVSPGPPSCDNCGEQSESLASKLMLSWHRMRNCWEVILYLT